MTVEACLYITEGLKRCYHYVRLRQLKTVQNNKNVHVIVYMYVCMRERSTNILSAHNSLCNMRHSFNLSIYL